MLNRSSKLLQQNNLNCSLVRGNGMELPFQNSCFNNIVATFPEQYITQSQTISECARILKNNPNENSRIIILGRWIVLHHKVLRLLFPVFYRLPTESQKSDVKELFLQHNLDAQFHEHKLGLVSVYIIDAKFVNK
jgi:ubiquinone/menaquinone biosynthesis C-methylase UbiE